MELELPWASKTRSDIGFCTCLLVNICVPGRILRLAFNELADSLALVHGTSIIL